MKRVLSIFLTITIVCSLFAGISVSAASSALGSGEMLFYSDFDNINPNTVLLDSNAVFELSDYGYALKLTTADDGNGTNIKSGAYYGVESFTHGSAWIKFDIKHNSGYHLHTTLWDSTGKAEHIRIQKGDVTANT